jgi:hypothetical protein
MGEIQPRMRWLEHVIFFYESAIPLYPIEDGGGTMIAHLATAGTPVTTRKLWISGKRKRFVSF